MDFKGLDLNLLVVLDVLLDEKNITRTGQRIHLSQSATSGALARLREFFQDEILVQVGHRMALTPLGDDLVKPVKDLLLQVRAVIDKTPVFNPATSTRRFTLMVSDYVAAVLLPRAIRRMRQEAPSVILELVPLADSPTEALERGEVDFLILPEHYLSPAHSSEELFKDQYACVVWAKNPLVGDSISMEQYLSMGHVGLRFGKQRTQSLDDWFLSNSGHTRRVELITMDFNIMPQLLIGTSRVATMHRRLAAHYAQHLPLRILDPPIEMPTLVEKLCWHSFRDLDPGHQWFRGILRAAAEELPVPPTRSERPRAIVAEAKASPARTYGARKVAGRKGNRKPGIARKREIRSS
jgi:LysR family nod box-dependent transcriptional activator